MGKKVVQERFLLYLRPEIIALRLYTASIITRQYKQTKTPLHIQIV